MEPVDGSGDSPERAAVSARVARSAAEREACFALRYRVLVEEMKRDCPTADHARKLYRLESDSTATQFYVSSGEDVIGVLRMHHGATAELPLEFREGCELHRFTSDTPVGQMVCLGGLVVEPGRRGGAALVPLFQGCFRFVMEEQPTTSLAFILALEDPRLLALYRMLGFRAIDPDKRWRLDIGLCLPMVTRITPGRRNG